MSVDASSGVDTLSGENFLANRPQKRRHRQTWKPKGDRQGLEDRLLALPAELEETARLIKQSGINGI
jgi:hypothetical protein